jgi:hypothetical protein
VLDREVRGQLAVADFGVARDRQVDTSLVRVDRVDEERGDADTFLREVGAQRIADRYWPRSPAR